MRAAIDNISHNSGFELNFDLSFPDAFGWIHEIDLRENTSVNYYSMKPVAMFIFFPRRSSTRWKYAKGEKNPKRAKILDQIMLSGRKNTDNN